MKVFLHYAPSTVSETHHKTLKITLPKKWTKLPPANLLSTFIDSYNDNKPTPLSMSLEASNLLLTTENGATVYALEGDAAVAVEDCIEDKADVYITPSVDVVDKTKVVKSFKQVAAAKASGKPDTGGAPPKPPGHVRCVHLGCQKYFDPATSPVCTHHKAPPVFHETAKWWSCCPHKKAYDWEGFQTIPGCEVGVCSNVKDADAASTSDFMGGCELRDPNGTNEDGPMDIATFNSKESSQKKIDGIGAAFTESWCDLDKASWEQMIQGMTKEVEKAGRGAGETTETTEEAVLKKLGAMLKKTCKAVIVEQMRL